MEKIDLTKIKYYPDRFYVCLDGFDINNLTTFLTDLKIEQHQSIFIHEYYHYLTNITSFPGIRQFHLNFCDRYRLVTILAERERLNAFPLNKNNFESCKDLIAYWNSVSSIIDEHDIDYKVVVETEKAPNKKFEIVSIVKLDKEVNFTNGELDYEGTETLVSIEVEGLLNIRSFNLTFGAIDEFFSSAIDEYLIENELSDMDPRLLNKRPFYPYSFFDKLLYYYDIKRPTAFDKILIAYFALNSFNPALTLIEVLEKLKGGDYDAFQKDPEQYLILNFIETPQYKDLLKKIDDFATETFNQGRVHISQALKYYSDKFYIAQKLKENDFFYFIRPFLVKEEELVKRKQKFLLAFGRIINLFTPPVILKEKEFWYVDKLTTFGEATMLILATYEIFESIKTQQIATRPLKLKEKYIFPDNNPDCDNLETFVRPPINGTVFQLALNELSLFGIYLEELERIRQNSN